MSLIFSVGVWGMGWSWVRNDSEQVEKPRQVSHADPVWLAVNWHPLPPLWKDFAVGDGIYLIVGGAYILALSHFLAFSVSHLNYCLDRHRRRGFGITRCRWPQSQPDQDSTKPGAACSSHLYVTLPSMVSVPPVKTDASLTQHTNKIILKVA